MFKLIIITFLITFSECFIGNPSPHVFLGNFLQVMSSSSATRNFVKGEDCSRKCSSSERPKICHFEWTLEMYSTLSR